MKRCCAVLALLLVLGSSSTFAVDPPLADGVSGAPIAWVDWVGKRGPVAVLVWASWVPEAGEVMDAYPEIEAACHEVGLHPVVLDVQESLADGRSVLAELQVSWIHDRHGALLKQYRVIEVPSILVVSAEGDALARLDPTAAAVRRWWRP